MNKIADTLETLIAAYPAISKNINAAALYTLWERKLAGFDAKTLQAATDMVIDHGKFFPNLNEFLDAARSVELNNRADQRDQQRQVTMTPELLRAAQVTLEDQAAGGDYDPCEWETLAEQWDQAGLECSAAACREKSRRIAGVMVPA